jgi:anti-sigma regulatory factor (Ser/Thr protein kinase)
MPPGIATTALPPQGDPRRRRAEDALSVRLSGGLEAAGEARRALSRLRGDIDPPVLETMRLLVTELIANSVKHAEADAVGLKVVVGSRSVLVEVRDEGPGFEPIARAEAQDPESGWGLFLVERMAERWGVARERRATRVWFELRRA